MSTDDLYKLKANLVEADAQVFIARERRCAAAEAFASAIAVKLGVSIGCVVQTVNSEIRSGGRKIVVRKYRVTKIAYKDYGANRISLHGKTIKANGEVGQIHEIWRDWTVVTDGKMIDILSPFIQQSPTERSS
jgi:hypothetical protein